MWPFCGSVSVYSTPQAIDIDQKRERGGWGVLEREEKSEMICNESKRTGERYIENSPEMNKQEREIEREREREI